MYRCMHPSTKFCVEFHVYHTKKKNVRYVAKNAHALSCSCILMLTHIKNAYVLGMLGSVYTLFSILN